MSLDGANGCGEPRFSVPATVVPRAPGTGTGGRLRIHRQSLGNRRGRGRVGDGRDQRDLADRRQQIGVALCRRPERVEPAVFRLEQPLADLEEPEDVGLSGGVEPIHAGAVATDELDRRLRAIDQFACAVPLAQGRPDLRRGLLPQLLQGDVVAPMLGLALADGGLARIENRHGQFDREAVEAHAGLVFFVGRPRGEDGEPFGPGQGNRRPRSGDGRLRHEDFRPARQRETHQVVLAGDVAGHGNRPEGFGCVGQRGDAQLVSEVRQGHCVVVLRRLAPLLQGLAFDFGQDQVGLRGGWPRPAASGSPGIAG